MTKYIRIAGGEKNSNSGKQWTKDELKQVLQLYLQNEDLKIHEHNHTIHKLAAELGRTVRSVEAQLLMFRNLRKHGDYGYGNMNKLCKELWVEHFSSLNK
jgi:ABC-type uncharacterized transport system YnjBCD substrate-binding protein